MVRPLSPIVNCFDCSMYVPGFNILAIPAAPAAIPPTIVDTSPPRKLASPPPKFKLLSTYEFSKYGNVY